MKKKKILIFIILFVIIIVLLAIYLIYTINNIKNNNSINHTTSYTNSINIENDVSSLSEITTNDIEQNIVKTKEEALLTQEEVIAYWEEYTNPNHWSENTKKHTLAYALKENKSEESDDYIVNADDIINDCLSDKKNGIYITKSSRIFLDDILKNDIGSIFYIDDKGMLKYNFSKYYVNTPIDDLLIYAIDNSSELYILDIGFAYIDEEQGNKPYTMPGELEYLQFNIETGKKLLIYNLYNFQFETFIKGIQTLTGKLLETK